MASGNPNPRTEFLTAPRFVKGQSGNPGGRSRAVLDLIQSNLERSLRIRDMMLTSLEKKLERAIEKDDVSAISHLTAEINKLMVDSENRGLGTPVQETRITGAGGGPVQSVNRDMTPAEAAAAYQATLASQSTGEEDDSSSE